MNNTEAKFILDAYRPNGRDADDPAMAGALAQAKSDPALGAWFAREQAHAAAVAQKLHAIEPPAGLREAILAGARVSGAPTERAWWMRRSGIGMAAAVAILAAGVAWWLPWRASASGSDLVAFAATDTERHMLHGGHGAANDAWQAALAEPSRHLQSGAMPVNFATLRDTGCRTLTVGGHDVLEVCFKRDGKWFHAYVARRADFPALATATVAQFAQRGKINSATWSDASLVYVVASEAPVEAVKRLL